MSWKTLILRAHGLGHGEVQAGSARNRVFRSILFSTLLNRSDHRSIPVGALAGRVDVQFARFIIHPEPCARDGRIAHRRPVDLTRGDSSDRSVLEDIEPFHPHREKRDRVTIRIFMPSVLVSAAVETLHRSSTNRGRGRFGADGKLRSRTRIGKRILPIRTDNRIPRLIGRRICRGTGCRHKHGLVEIHEVFQKRVSLGARSIETRLRVIGFIGGFGHLHLAGRIQLEDLIARSALTHGANRSGLRYPSAGSRRVFRRFANLGDDKIRGGFRGLPRLDALGGGLGGYVLGSRRRDKGDQDSRKKHEHGENDNQRDTGTRAVTALKSDGGG